jgi:hypothetical protein
MSGESTDTAPIGAVPNLDGVVVASTHHDLVSDLKAANRLSVIMQRSHANTFIQIPFLNRFVITTAVKNITEKGDTSRSDERKQRGR